MNTPSTSRRGLRGFTLPEVVFTVVMLAILAKVTLPKLPSPAALTLPAQAQSVADTVRRAQNLATQRSQKVRVNIATAGANGVLKVECLPVDSPCATDATLTLGQGAVLGGSAVYFNKLGVPVDSVTGVAIGTDTALTVSFGTGLAAKTYTVTVAALTGRVSVSN